MKAKQLIICVTIALFFISGCNQPNSPEVEKDAQGENQAQAQQLQSEQYTPKKDWTRSLFGPGPASYGSITDQSAHYDPVTESNVTGKSYRSLNAPRQTEDEDQIQIRNVIDDMPGFEPSMVILVGAHAWVNVTAESNLTKKQQEDQTTYIKQELNEANPRFDYKVKIVETDS